MSEKITIFKQQLFKKKNHMIFFKFSPDNLLIVLYKLIKVSSLYLLYFQRYHICKIAENKIQKRAKTQKRHMIYFFKFSPNILLIILH